MRWRANASPSRARLLPAEGSGRRGAFLGAIGGFAAALGPLVGGLLLSLSWRWIFIVNVPIGLAANDEATIPAIVFSQASEED